AVLRNASSYTRLELSQFESGGTSLVSEKNTQFPSVKLPIGSLQRFETEVKKALAELGEMVQTHDVTVFCENAGEKKRFEELLDQDQPGLKERVRIPIGYLHRGFVWNEGEKPLALLGHHELFHRYEQRRRSSKVTASRPV